MKLGSFSFFLSRIDDYLPGAESMLDTVPLGTLALPTAPTLTLPPIDQSSTPLSSSSPTSSPSSSPSILSSPGEIERASLESLVAHSLAFVDKMRGQVAGWVFQRMIRAYGPVPDDPVMLSYWMALVSLAFVLSGI